MGFSAVGTIAIPAILAHAQIITAGALVMELAAAVLLLSTIAMFDHYNTKDLYY